MLFLVCFRCIQVCTYEEGHRCPHIDGNEDETNSKNVSLVRAELANFRKASTREADNISNLWFRRRKRSRRGDFIFSMVASESGSKPTDIECRTTNNDVCGINEATRTEKGDNFHPLEPEPRNSNAESYTHTAAPQQRAHSSHQPARDKGNKNASIQSTDIVEFPAVPQQRAHSSRQPTWDEGNNSRYTHYRVSGSSSADSSLFSSTYRGRRQ